MASGSVITLADPHALPEPERALTAPGRESSGSEHDLPTSEPDAHAHPHPHPSPHAAAPAAFDLAAAYDAHGSALFGFAVNTLRDRGLAEDCVQETFLRAWRARDRYDGARASTRTWLFAIERNVIIDVQRSLTRTPRIADGEILDEVADETSDPLERLQIAEAIASLSDEHRDVVVAVHLEGETYAELSASSGVPVATLRTRAFYALRALRTRLTGGDAS